MSDFDDGEDFVSEKQREFQRFVALGGGIPIQKELRALKRLQHGEEVFLKDHVTDGHRELVGDLAAAGLSPASIGDILGISGAYVEELFPYEMGTGFNLAKANLVRSVYRKGLAGDTQAALGWLRSHNRSDWRQKTELTGKDGGAVEVEAKGGKSLEEAKTWLTATVNAMLGDAKLKGPDYVPGQKKVLPGKDQKAETPKRRSMKQVREEDPEDDEDDK